MNILLPILYSLTIELVASIDHNGALSLKSYLNELISGWFDCWQ